MTTLYVCRHGESENNRLGRLSGWIDTPLTEAGKQNAASSAEKLAGIYIDQVVSSDLGRAFMTAYLIARRIGYAGAIEVHSGLREMNYGDWANQPLNVYPSLPPEQNAIFIPPRGESLQQMQQRVLGRIRKIAIAYEGKTLLVVGHDGTINALRASFLRRSIGAVDATHNAHDFVAKTVWRGGRIVSFHEIG